MNVIAQRLLAKIEQGVYPPGALLPSIPELVRQYCVEAGAVRRVVGELCYEWASEDEALAALEEKVCLAIGDLIYEWASEKDMLATLEETVHLAIADLIYEGVIERLPGDRSRLRVRVPPHALWGTITGNHSVTKEAQKRGQQVGTKILRFETVPSWSGVRQRLNLEPADEVIIMERLRLADDEPVQLEFSYYPAKFYPGMQLEWFTGGGEGQSSFKIMEEKFGLKSARAVDEVAVAALEAREAELLKMDEGTPVLIRFRVTLSDKDIPIKGSRAIYKFKAGYELAI